MSTDETMNPPGEAPAPDPPKKRGKLSLSKPTIAPDPVKADDETRERAENAAEKLLGTRAGSALLVADMFKNLATDNADALIEMLEGTAAQLDNVTIKGVRYTPINLLTIMPDEMEKAWDLLGELWEEMTIGDSLSIPRAIRVAMSDDRVDSLLAIMFIPEGADDDQRENYAERIPHMRKLNVGQRLGALWRFFTSVAPSVADSLRTFLQRAGTVNLLRFVGQ